MNDTYVVQEISVKEIKPAKGNRAFEGQDVKELKASIAEVGLINPLLLEKNGDGYLIVAGHRRFAAVKQLKWNEVPAMIVDDAHDTDTLRITDNIQRADIHPMDEAIELDTLLQKHNDVNVVASLIGKSRAYVYSRLRLLNLCEGARESYKQGSYSHAIFGELARLTKEQQKKMMDEMNHMWAPISLTRYKSQMEEMFFMKLKDAPFDIKSEDLFPEAGSCIACPKRASNSEMLFEDLVSSDTCTDSSCWKKKREKNYRLQIRLVKEADEDLHQLSEDHWNVAADKIADDKWELAKKKDKDSKKGIIAGGYNKGKVVYFKDKRSAKEIKAQTPEGLKKQKEKKAKDKIEADSITREHANCIRHAIDQPLRDFLNQKYLEGNGRLEELALGNVIAGAFEDTLLNDHFEIGVEIEGYIQYPQRETIREWFKDKVNKEFFMEHIFDLAMKAYFADAEMHNYRDEFSEAAELARSLGFDPEKAVKEGMIQGDLDFAEMKAKERQDAEDKKKAAAKEKEDKHNEEMVKGSKPAEPEEYLANKAVKESGDENLAAVHLSEDDIISMDELAEEENADEIISDIF